LWHLVYINCWHISEQFKTIVFVRPSTRYINANLNEVLIVYFSFLLIPLAVVGGGISGASTAFFLRQQFGEDAVIDVYEKGEVGGRLATINLDSKLYEAGGSIIHEKNAYMVNFTNLLG